MHVAELGLHVLHGADHAVNGVFAPFAQGAYAGILAVAHAVEDLEYEVGLVLAVLVEGLLGHAEFTGEVVHAHGADPNAPEDLFTALEQLDEACVLCGSLCGWRHPNWISGRKSTPSCQVWGNETCVKTFPAFQVRKILSIQANAERLHESCEVRGVEPGAPEAVLGGVDGPSGCTAEIGFAEVGPVKDDIAQTLLSHVVLRASLP